MSYNRIDSVIEILEKALKEERTLPSVCREYGYYPDYASDYIRKKMDDQLERDIIDIEKHGTVKNLHEEYKENLNDIKRKERKREQDKLMNNSDEGEMIDEGEERLTKEDVEYDATSDQEYEDRNIGETIRDGEDTITLDHSFSEEEKGVEVNKITGYRYCIKVRGEEDLKGELSREDMEKIYQLYSNIEGPGLTQRRLSTYFNNLTLKDLKRILRAFNITKQTVPVPPHIIEEKTEDEILDIINENRERNVLKRIDQEKVQMLEKRNKELIRENYELKESINDWGETLKDLEFNLTEITPFYIEKKEVDKERAMVVYLSDQHVGAHTEEDSIYENRYDEEVFRQRMAKTIEDIQEEYELYGRFDELIICNLGDPIDGLNKKTTRGGHELSQNMNNKEQFTTYVHNMIAFFDKLHELDMSNKISYHAMVNDNHAGHASFMVNESLRLVLNTKYPEMDLNVFEKFIDYIEYGEHTLILSHGKDEEYMRSGFPLSLDAQTERYFMNYIIDHDIRNPYISVIMGDLHQSSCQYGKKFRYKRVLSMYGSSKYIHTLFGKGRAGVEYDIIDKHSSKVRSGVVEFKEAG